MQKGRPTLANRKTGQQAFRKKVEVAVEASHIRKKKERNKCVVPPFLDCFAKNPYATLAKGCEHLT